VSTIASQTDCEIPTRSATASGRQEQQRIDGDRCADQVREIAAEAEGDGAGRQEIGHEHQPSGHEADPWPERQRGVLELR
jgi:hypothetical protein